MMDVGGLAPGELALRLSALLGTAAYAAYLASAADIDAALAELDAEVRTLGSDAAVTLSAPRDGGQLVEAVTATTVETVLVDARAFSADDWSLLDRRRSSLAHRGVLVFVTTAGSFDELMRHAPNLASWLGGEVFAYPHDEAAVAAHRERRLEALRVWASRTDDEVIAAARAGTLPRDPEYAEWLVLLGHGDLVWSGGA